MWWLTVWHSFPPGRRHQWVIIIHKPHLPDGKQSTTDTGFSPQASAAIRYMFYMHLGPAWKSCWKRLLLTCLNYIRVSLNQHQQVSSCKPNDGKGAPNAINVHSRNLFGLITAQWHLNQGDFSKCLQFSNRQSASVYCRHTCFGLTANIKHALQWHFED